MRNKPRSIAFQLILLFTLAAALYLLFFVPLVVASRWLEGLGPQRH